MTTRLASEEQLVARIARIADGADDGVNGDVIAMAVVAASAGNLKPADFFDRLSVIGAAALLITDYNVFPFQPSSRPLPEFDACLEVIRKTIPGAGDDVAALRRKIGHALTGGLYAPRVGRPPKDEAGTAFAAFVDLLLSAVLVETRCRGFLTAAVTMKTVERTADRCWRCYERLPPFIRLPMERTARARERAGDVYIHQRIKKHVVSRLRPFARS